MCSFSKGDKKRMKSIPWGPIRSLLKDNFSFGDIKNIISLTGIDISRLSHLEQKQTNGATKSQLLSKIDQLVSELEDDEKKRVASICCEEILIQKGELSSELERVFSRVGWKFSGKFLIPIEIFDLEELSDIPFLAHEDIIKSAVRLRDGDLSGSLSAACGAIDSVTNQIYAELNLGEPDKDSFQARIKKSLNAISAIPNLSNELSSLGWKSQDIKPLCSNLDGSLNQAAFVMQKLRSDMGDVHGSKPTINAVIYDSIKWSLLILRLLSGR